MTDIVERLRERTEWGREATMMEAADEIEKLRAEIERLKNTNQQHYDEGYVHGRRHPPGAALAGNGGEEKG